MDYLYCDKLLVYIITIFPHLNYYSGICKHSEQRPWTLILFTKCVNNHHGDSERWQDISCAVHIGTETSNITSQTILLGNLNTYYMLFFLTYWYSQTALSVVHWAIMHSSIYTDEFYMYIVFYCSHLALFSHSWHPVLRLRTRLSCRLNNNVYKPHIGRKIAHDINWCVVIIFPQSHWKSQTELYDDRSAF